MLFGVYIAGPGLVGEHLVRELSGALALYETQDKADRAASVLAAVRPYHCVTARYYEAGDELSGLISQHPDGTTP